VNAQVLAVISTALGVIAALIKWKMYVESDDYALKCIREEITKVTEELRIALGKGDGVAASRCQRKLFELRESSDRINKRRTDTANTKGPSIPR